jgi:thiosulfate/3-mercaptopyruvate sulfurtransferase
MNRIVDMKWVRDHLEDPGVVLVDCRFVLGKPDYGREAYLREHIPGAFYLDLEKDLSGTAGPAGGRHPLPEPDRFAAKLGAIGVNETVHVVAYDDQGGAMASRLWWLLTYFGHHRVSVMNGTFSLWKERGYPVTAQVPETSPRLFTPRPQPGMLVDATEVLRKLNDPDSILVDSRELKRYLGEEEPIDPVAGRIPGAEHSFWKGVLNENGEWKSPDELAEHFARFPRDKELIVYCGSGVTATPNILGLKEAGFEKVKLYAGSWSDWITDPNRPVEKGTK